MIRNNAVTNAAKQSIAARGFFELFYRWNGGIGGGRIGGCEVLRKRCAYFFLSLPIIPIIPIFSFY